MMMVSIKVNGLYAWGNGWVSTEAHKLWDNYWASINDCLWNYGEAMSLCSCGYLYNTRNAYYNHPMGEKFILHASPVAVNGSCFNAELNALHRLFRKCAEFINKQMGSEVMTFQITHSDPQAVEFGETTNVVEG